MGPMSESHIYIQNKQLSRFWFKVLNYNEYDCWNWIGSKNSRGYGTVGYQKRIWLAHRLSWFFKYGFFTPGKILNHLCLNTSCVNPLHLEEVTHKENSNYGCLYGKMSVKPMVEAHAKNCRAKKYCKHGHEFTVENTIIRKNGNRSCRKCMQRHWREHARKKYNKIRKDGIRSSCVNGHNYSDGNFYINSKGSKICKICEEKRIKRMKEKKLTQNR